MAQGKLTTSEHISEWPATLQAAARKALLVVEDWRPTIIEMNQHGAMQLLDELIDERPIYQIVDNYDEQYAELIVSRHPQLYRATLEVKRESLKEYLEKHYAGKKSWQLGSWVYFSWSGKLVHILEKELFLESRTIRNKDLISNQEQQEYADFTVGCAGMSVGSNVAMALALSGGSQKIKLADGAVISASNLNRVMTGVSSVGDVKARVIARQLFEMNPYMSIECLDKLTDDDVDSFFEQPWPLRVVVDEVDDLKAKILLRIKARERGIPVIMATDLGDDVMLDIERFDLNKELPLFHGLIPNVEDLLVKEVNKREWLKYATAIIDPNNVPLRMQQSLLKVGSKLVTQPQLGPTAMMSGAVAAYAIRQLATGQKLRSGRTIISLDRHLRTDLVTLKHSRLRKKHTQRLKQALKAM